MSKINVLQRPSRKAHLPRNSFDRGYRMTFNGSAGMLLPTFSAFVEGGSHCKFNMNNFIRTAAVNTAAFTIMDFHTEFFAVPIRQLMSTWGVFRTRTKDIHSTKFGTPNSRIPALKTNELYSLVGQTTPIYDSLGYPWIDGCARLMDLLNYGITANSIQPSNKFNQNVDLNPFYLAAYQKVYYDHFRNTSYEANDPKAYNLDQFINADGTVNSITQDVIEKLGTLRYVDYRKDMFSNVYPSLYYVKEGNLQGVNVPTNIIGRGSNPKLVGSNTLYLSDTVSVVTPSQSNTSVNQIIPLQNLRVAFAIDKLLRLSAYAPQHVVDQFEARFGFRPFAEGLEESIRLGSYKSDIIIGEVTSTATTGQGSDGYLGAIGGKGIGSSDYGKTIIFDAKEDCVVLGISYMIPRMMYDSIAIDPFNTKFVPEDYIVPEFMDMGLQPLYFKTLRLTHGSGVTEYDITEGNQIMGYQPRYSEYKLGVDRNHGEFDGQRIFHDYVTHSRTRMHYYSSTAGLNYTQLKVDPADLNSIFAEEYDGAEHTDQYFGTIQFAFACVQNLSVHGESNL